MPVRPTTPRSSLLAATLLALVLPSAALAQSPAASGGAASLAPSSPAAGGTWFDGLATGVCFEVTLDGTDRIDFSVPPAVVECAQPHANEVAGIVDLGDGALPADVDRLALAGCDAVTTAFLGRPIASMSTLLFPFTTWPDATDWANGARQAICAVAGNGLIGSVASGDLAAPGETLAAFWQEGDSAEIHLLDGATGSSLRALTDAATTELLGPPAWAPDGSAVLFGAQLAEDDTDLFRAATDGSGVEPVLVGPGRQEGGDLSPDGRRVAYINNSAGGEYDIWVAPLDGTDGAAITDHPERDATPRWSPDGSRILFRRVTDGLSEIWVMAADGSDPHRLIDNGVDSYDPRWSPDGTAILYTTALDGTMDIWTATADGVDPRPLTDHPGAEEYPTFSRDGSRIAFMSDRLGTPTIWVINADGTGASLLSTLSPAGYPAFAPVALGD